MCEKCEYANEVMHAVVAVVVDGEDISTLGPHHPTDVRLAIAAFVDAVSSLHATALIGEAIVGREGSRLLDGDAEIAFDPDVRAMDRAEDEKDVRPLSDAEIAAMLDDFANSEPDDFRI